MDTLVRELARRQADVVAAWQLMAAGWARRRVRHHAKRDAWRPVHSGVFVLSQAPLTRRQLWIAAALTAPQTVVSHASAASCWGFRPFEGTYETVTRPGSAGPRRFGEVLISRAALPPDDVTHHHGVPITTVPRTHLDLAPFLDDKGVRRAFRESIRLKLTTAERLRDYADRHRTRRRANQLRDLAARYATLPYARARSDAECHALETLHDAGITPPALNVRIAGEEADLVWRDRRLIIEIDGPQYHRFRDEDLRKQARWEGAGYEVRRLPSSVVYDRPRRLLNAAG
jgi:hypothetical protein